MGPKAEVKLDSKLDDLTDEVKDLADDIDETNRLGKSLQDSTDNLPLFKARLTRLDGTFQKFLDRVGEAIRIAKQLENKEAITDLTGLRKTIRESFYESLSLNSNSTDRASDSTLNTSALVNPITPIKLPTVNLPTFNGDLSSWASFKDTFKSLVHDNDNLSPVQKFHYLKSALKGTAAQTISAIPIANKDYEAAWETLNNRFNNKRLQATNHLTKIFNFKPLQSHSFSQLELFSETVLENAAAFNRLNIPDKSGFLLYTFALRLLDSKTRDKFENSMVDRSEIPTFADFEKFIHQQCTLLHSESITAAPIPHGPKSSPSNNRTNKRVLMSMSSSPTDSNTCPSCHAKHRLYRCSAFLSLNPNQRYDLVKKLKLCTNCLSSQHLAFKCQSSALCRFCNKSHNSLLHFPSAGSNLSKSSPVTQTAVVRKDSSPPERAAAQPSSELSHSEASKGTVFSASEEGKVCVLLGTAIARVQTHDGQYLSIRILIDSGSQRSFITASCAKQLGLKVSDNTQPLKGFSGYSIQGAKHQILCTIAPKHTITPTLTTSAVIVRHITDKMPMWPLPNSVQHYASQFELADPLFWQPGPIDFLLGADLFSDILLGECISSPDGYPSVLKTIFGGVLIGPTKTHCMSEISSFAIFAPSRPSKATSLDTLIHRFWEVDTVGTPPPLDPEEVKCEEMFVSTHSRDESGRYIVRFPFRNSRPVEFSGSHNLALTRFRKLEYRLDKMPDLKQEYSRVIESYIDSNYITPSSQQGVFYLPHHCVVKDSSSTKVRIVFDASASTANGSLNEHLLSGTKLQLDVKDVILNFRRFPYVLTADICQMYLQIVVHPDDRPFQHFLYRFNATEPISDYQINRLSFGLSCSPYLAIRVLHQLVQDEGLSFPKAAIALKEHIYVDDILTGAESLTEALELQRQLIQLLGKGGFLLKKWSSNSPTLLKMVPHEQDETSFLFSDPDSSGVKILGLRWDPSEDSLSYSIQTTPHPLTKRGVMSTIARMYDPLGYLSPVVFKAKTILQNLWSLKLDWDTNLPPTLGETWRKFFETLKTLSEVRIPRCMFTTQPELSTLVGFSDASSSGYAAVVYLRNQFPSGSVQTYLLISKTRLAPLKTLSIPRLELCGALLLVQTLQSLSDFLQHVPINAKYLFTDSTIVLNWLRLSPHKLKTFVANRVTAILEGSNIHDWHHVPSTDNSADIASRGLEAPSLIHCRLWWNGPEWLMDNVSSWPSSVGNVISPLPETKSESVMLMNHSVPSSFDEFVERFSSFPKLIRSFAYVLRFISNLKPGSLSNCSNFLTVLELRTATNQLIKLTQKRYFGSDMSGSGKKGNSLGSLSPFLDNNGIWRVGGRISNSSVPYNAKHPILLPAKSHFTLILIDFLHHSYLHAGPQLLQSLIQRNYWIVSARRIIRSRVHQCLKCHRFRAKTFTPYMADLPPSRFEQGRAFIHTGIDFAGPFFIKESHRRKAVQHKAYICLFVCMSTKSVHLEVVSDLTTNAFLACLDRFIARRGLPAKIFSDHGTNFVGANRRLTDFYRWLKDDKTQHNIMTHLSAKEVKWEYIPPAAPHFGGLWEAGVKSFKSHLNRVLDRNVLTFEELNTLAVKIEAVLNSRPLYALSSDPNEFDTLTPGHFLIGGPLLTLPEPDYTDTRVNRLTRWQHLNQCIQHIWQRWRHDYLNSLQHRVKWRQVTPNIEPGTLVLLKDDAAPPLYWPTGRVTETLTGPDGITRVVKLITPKGEYVRPVTRLAPLLPN